jgi:hypothetical protein
LIVAAVVAVVAVVAVGKKLAAGTLRGGALCLERMGKQGSSAAPALAETVSAGNSVGERRAGRQWHDAGGDEEEVCILDELLLHQKQRQKKAAIETLSHFAQKELSGTMTVRGMQAKSRDINLELTARRRALCSGSFAQHIHQRCRDPLTASRNYGVRYGVECKKREAVNSHIKGT